MKIVVISPVYPSKNAPIGTTPVVHYFTREWVKMGHNVIVLHLETQYPFYIYWATRLFEDKLNSKLGYLVSTKKPQEYEEINEGVKVFHYAIKKKKPMPRFSKSEIEKVCSRIALFCEKEGGIDIFIGHWDSPQLEILSYLKHKFPTTRNALILHSLNRDLKQTYFNDFELLFNDIDIVGFRSPMAMEQFKMRYFSPKKVFTASSGISELFLENLQVKKFERKVTKFVFVGSLIQRKHPIEIITALSRVYGDDEYTITYIGEGNEDENILRTFKRLNKNGKLEMIGRIDRSKVISYLKSADVFVMISDNETFGLVYLEAMALGCITIASKGGGVDGIIKNGENGFLCNPGDPEELSRIINTIRNLNMQELQLISSNAVYVASQYTDKIVAHNYLKAVIS